jgi:hypothetical protein
MEIFQGWQAFDDTRNEPWFVNNFAKVFFMSGFNKEGGGDELAGGVGY